MIENSTFLRAELDAKVKQPLSRSNKENAFIQFSLRNLNYQNSEFEYKTQVLIHQIKYNSYTNS